MFRQFYKHQSRSIIAVTIPAVTAYISYALGKSTELESSIDKNTSSPKYENLVILSGTANHGNSLYKLCLKMIICILMVFLIFYNICQAYRNKLLTF